MAGLEFSLSAIAKLEALLFSTLGLWVYWKWLRVRGQKHGIPPESQPPGEVTQLILKSLAKHPEQWRAIDEHCLAWSQSPDQLAPVKLHFDAKAGSVCVEGMLGAELNALDQSRVIVAIQKLPEVRRKMSTTDLPPELGEVARQVILSLRNEPENWYEFEENRCVFSPKPIKHSYQAKAKLWINGHTHLRFHSTEAGDVDVEFDKTDCKYVWAAYKAWYTANKDRILSCQGSRTRTILTEHRSPESTVH